MRAREFTQTLYKRGLLGLLLGLTCNENTAWERIRAEDVGGIVRKIFVGRKVQKTINDKYIAKHQVGRSSQAKTPLEQLERPASSP